MLNKVIRSLYYILFFLAPLVMFAKTSEIFELNKLFFIYIMTVLIGGTWLIKIILSQKITFRLHFFHWIVLIFIATQLLSTVFSIDRHTSLFGYYGRFNGGLLSVLCYSLLLFVFISEGSLAFIKNILKVSVISSAVVILWGLPGKLSYDLTCGIFTGNFSTDCWTNQFRPEERMFSTIGQPNWLGAYVAIHFFIGLYYFLRNELDKTVHKKGKKEILQNVAISIYMILAFSVILFTKSRSALLSVLIGLIIFPLTFILYKNKAQIQTISKKYFLLLLLLAFPVLLFKTGINKVDKFIPFQHKETQISSEKNQTNPQAQKNINVTESFDIRKIVWKGAWKLALQYPVFGSGVETFAYSYYFTRPLEHNATSEWDFLYNKAHNEYLNYLATTGFVGVSAYLLMIASVFYLYYKRVTLNNKELPFVENQYDDYRLLISCVCLSYLTILITNFFGFSTTTINLYFYIIPAFFLCTKEYDIDFKSQKLQLLNLIKIIGVATIATSAIYFFVTYWIADIKFSDAETKIRSGEYAEAASVLIDVIKYHYEHVYDDKLSLAVIGTALSSNDKEGTEKLIFLSDYYNKRALNASPYNPLYWKTRASIFYNAYQITLNEEYLSKAVEALKTVQKIAPTDPRIPYTLAQYELAYFDVKKDRANLNAMQKDIQKTLELKPDYIEALFLKAEILKKAGKNNEALKVFEYVLKTYDPTNEEIKAKIDELK